MSEIYSNERKKRLVEKINKLRDPNVLKKIKNLIISNNPDLALIKNSNGYFMQFQNLSMKTYFEIDKYLDRIEKQDRINKQELENHENTDSQSTDNMTMSASNEHNKAKKLRLTNIETHILNRKRYEKQLKINETGEDESDEEELVYFGRESEKKETIEKIESEVKTGDIFCKTSKNPVKRTTKK